MASISRARNAPNNPSAPGDAKRLAPTSASGARLRKGCRLIDWRPDASITRSARNLGRGQHDHRIAGADDLAVHLGPHLFGDDMRVDGILDDSGADEQDQL